MTAPEPTTARPTGRAVQASDDLMQIAHDQPPFAQLLGLRVISATPDCVLGELPVTDGLANRNGVLHGGAIMALADNMGGTATFLNIGPDEGTTTVESKTNFFRAIRIGDIARTETTPLHRGRTTMVWQTRISGRDGKLAALVTQTQMILRKSAR